MAALGRDQLDVTRPHEVEAALRWFAPDAVIHAAAFTDVDRCEQEPELARQVNAEATARLARACARRGVPLVYVSTDYVFSGRRWAPYRCDDPPDPLSVYGWTKLEGEKAVREAGGPFAVVRTAWVYSTRGRNFPLALLDAAAQGRPLSVVTDQVGSPTYARDLARALMKLLALGLHTSGRIFHVVNEGACSRYEMAVRLLALAGWAVRVEPVPTRRYPRPAPRPPYSALDTYETRCVGIRLRDWRQALAAFVEELRPLQPHRFPPGLQP